MTTETVKVSWPRKLGLIFRRSLLTEKEQQTVPDLGKGEIVAYQLGFSREEIIWGKNGITQTEEPQDRLAFQHFYDCQPYGAYYLTRVVVRPLDGKMLPEGILHVHLDGELIMEGPISDFLQDFESLDCLKPYPWRKTTGVFKANTLNPTGAADPGNQVGFMMPNHSNLEVRLVHLTAKETVTLEIGLISAYYSTKLGEVKA